MIPLSVVNPTIFVSPKTSRGDTGDKLPIPTAAAELNSAAAEPSSASCFPRKAAASGFI